MSGAAACDTWVVPTTSLVSVLTVSVAGGVVSTGGAAASTGAIAPTTSLGSVPTVSVTVVSTGCIAASTGAIAPATSLLRLPTVPNRWAEPMIDGLNESPSTLD